MVKHSHQINLSDKCNYTKNSTDNNAVIGAAVSNH